MGRKSPMKDCLERQRIVSHYFFIQKGKRNLHHLNQVTNFNVTSSQTANVCLLMQVLRIPKHLIGTLTQI